jgi:hypothetical protein
MGKDVSVAPISAGGRPPAAIQRSGRRLAALLFAVFSLLACLIVFGDRIGSAVPLIMSAGAITGATIAGSLLWSRLAFGRQGLSFIGAIFAGILTVPAANFAMWLVAWLTLLVAGLFDAKVGVTASEWAGQAAQVGGVLPLFTLATTVRFGHLGFPLAILASVLATLWCRRRLSGAGLPSNVSDM